MIHMTQIKVPVERVLKVTRAEDAKQGIIGEEEKELVKAAVAKAMRIPTDQVHHLKILRRSMDARKKQQIHFIYQITFRNTKEQNLVRRYGKNDARCEQEQKAFHTQVWREQEKTQEELTVPPVVVGMGPAGLFAAYRLAMAGMRPVVIERGADVDSRQQIVEHFWATGEFQEQTNVQFGEGGAGTFSDGKLNTLVKDSSGRNRQVLQIFTEFGAPEQILYLQKPHIGTDRLRQVVKAMREEIQALGGQVHFLTTLKDCIWQDDVLQEIIVEQEGQEKHWPCHQLILATGHSARETVTALYQKGVEMKAKPFAMGVRVEHPQEMIGRNQYGEFYKQLPAADYKLTYTTQSGRGVYSFCMCPGGYVVNASSEKGRSVVNGMSNYRRDSENANSAVVVTITPEDYNGVDDPLAGIAYQRQLEEAAYHAGQGNIPVQLFGDFKESKTSTAFGKISPCMKGAYQLANVRDMLPTFMGEALEEGIHAFERRIPGYSRADALVSGIESRTSSPVQITRNEQLQSNIAGIYPCGEGAGYAGGITSAAMDGLKVAEQILNDWEQSK